MPRARDIARVRHLLRLAASTTFPAEAETARAKARELQARHGITEEMLMEPRRPAPDPVQPQYRPVPFGGVVFTAATATGNTSWPGTVFVAGDIYIRFG